MTPLAETVEHLHAAMLHDFRLLILANFIFAIAVIVALWRRP